MAPMEFDSDYVWALEVLYCHNNGSLPSPSSEAVGEARAILDEEGLTEPMERL